MKKQAVIVIHGMGEQIPMETLNGFVEAVWTQDQALLNKKKPSPNSGQSRANGPAENEAWYKPDTTSGSFELRRITTESFKDAEGENRRTDFFEYYWAHHVKGMTIKDIRSWMISLLGRNPFTSVPKDVLLSWICLWVFTLAALGIIIFKALPAIYLPQDGFLPQGLGSAILKIIISMTILALGGFLSKVITSYLGDVVRYVRPHPPNIAARQKIREEGVLLLEKILKAETRGEKKYDRVIIAAHSLGTIVAYDILTHAFARLNTQYEVRKNNKGAIIPPKPEPERVEIENMIRHGGFTVDKYQNQQKKAQDELIEQGHLWRVTDFITMGSPLTHAEFLLAKDMVGVRNAQKTRSFPTCPPVLEYSERYKKMRFTYRGSSKAKGSIYNRYASYIRANKSLDADKKKELLAADNAPQYPHHASPFAYTRWSNIFSPSRFILWGDQVSGPLAETFGQGIRDIQVMPGLIKDDASVKNQKSRLLAHTKYWSLKGSSKVRSGSYETPYHIEVLRQVLDLKCEYKNKS